MSDDRAQVSKTPLSEQGRSLQGGFVSARRGLATNVGNLERASDQAKVLNNYQMIKTGVWTTRGIGWTEHRATAFNSGGTFLDFAQFIDSAGVRTLIWQCGTKLQSYNLATQTETDIKTGLSASAYPTMRGSYSPATGAAVVIYCNGNIEPRKILTTSTEAALAFNGGVWPGVFNGKTYSKPKLCEPFGTRFIYGGFNGATVAFDVLISDHMNAEGFTTSTPGVATDAVAFTYPPELGALTALRVVTMSNDSNEQIIIGGCTNGIFAIFGSDATSFGLKILTREVGILSNRCFVQLGNDILYLSTDGFRTLSALTLNATLGQDALSFGIQDLVDLIDDDAAHVAHAVHHPKTQEVQFWVPLINDAGVPQHCFVMKYEAVNGQLVPIWSTKSGTTVTSSIVFKGVMYGGNNAGKLQVHYSGNTYNGTAISSQMVLSLVGLGNPAQKCSMRTITILTDGPGQKFIFSASRYTRRTGGNMLRTRAKPGSKELSLAQVAGTALDFWILGTGAFPSDHIKTIDYQPLGQGIWWDFELSTSSSDHALDFAGAAYTLSGGGIQR